MLRLLAQREQGYEDIAALMGISVEEVRARVTDALAQLEAEGKEAPAVPEPPVPEPPPEEKAPISPAEAEKPPAEQAKTEEQPPPPPKAAPSPPPASSGRKSRLPKDPAIRAAMAAGVLVIALLAIFLIVNGSGGDSDSSASSADTTETSGAENAGNEGAANGSASRGLTKAVLEPVDGSAATGVAIFGRVGKKLALQVEAEGLQPTTKGTSYTLWLAQSPQRMLPLAETATTKSGRIGARFEVPVELLAYLATETFDQLVITRTDDARLEAELAKATKEEVSPKYTGTPVLAGTVTGPLVGIAKRAQSE
jgi:hypothetical protein